jgi:hypothetical protein
LAGKQRIALALAASLTAAAFCGAAQAQTSTSTSTTASLTVIEPALTVTKTSDLAFGAVVRPTSGSGTISIDANNGNVQTGGGVAVASVGGPATRASYTVAGVPNRNIQVTLPNNFAMTRSGGSETLTVTLTSSMGGGQIGSGGSVSFYVGGQVVLASTTVAGAYSGDFSVTVAYN